MRDPFVTVSDLGNVGQQSSNEHMLPDMMPSGAGYMLGNGDSQVLNTTSDSLIRHKFERASGSGNLRGGHFDNRYLDPEMMELYSRCRSQEEEILLLHKQIADASVKELELLKEKHVLERKLCDLRMAIDEKQEVAISGTMKELTQRKSSLEENIRLSNDLKDAEEELFTFTSSLLSLLAEYSIRPPMLNASTITNGTKRLYHHMQWKIRSSSVGFDDMKHMLENQPGNVTSGDNHQNSSKSQLSQPHMDPKLNNVHQYNRYPVDMRGESAFDQSRFIQDYDMMDTKDVNIAPNSDMHYSYINDKPRELSSTLYKGTGATNASNFFEDNTNEATNRTAHDHQGSFISEGEASLPGIEGFQIVGEAKPGNTLRACGYPTNGTTLCIFQWVRHLQNGTRQYIEGATVPDYVVTADDVDTLLAVDCTPMDDNGRQGELVRQFANNQNKITCDPDMLQKIETYTSTGRAIFTVLLLMDPSDDWEPSILTLKRSSYQIKVKRTEAVVMEEKYSPDLYIKVPYGLSNQFVLICSDGTNLPFSTDGTSQPNSLENDIRLRDIIVLVMRFFQNKALDGKRKGKA